MQAMTRLSGAFAPIPTPLDRNDRFDPGALRAHLDWLTSEGIDGALVLGTNGEFPSFTLAERRNIAESAAGSSRLTLLLNVGSCALGEARELLAMAADLGYAGALCPPPFYFTSAPLEGLAAFFRALLAEARLPLLLYHIPQVTGVALDQPLLDAIGAHPRLAGIKDSTGSVAELSRLSAHFRAGSYLVGNDRLVRAAREAGGRGSISAAANVVPALVKAAATDADSQARLVAVRDLLEEAGLGPSVKALLRQRGFGAYASRPPLHTLHPPDAQQLATRLEAIGD